MNDPDLNDPPIGAPPMSLSITPSDRLRDLGLELPRPAAPIANYVPFVVSDTMLIISGQLCLGPGGVLAPEHRGRLGADVTPEAGHGAARLCALHVLAQAAIAISGLERIRRLIRLGGFIAATPDFTALPAVMNGASDLMVAVLGEAGRHARTTIGVAALPLGAAVEVEAWFEIDRP